METFQGLIFFILANAFIFVGVPFTPVYFSFCTNNCASTTILLYQGRKIPETFVKLKGVNNPLWIFIVTAKAFPPYLFDIHIFFSESTLLPLLRANYWNFLLKSQNIPYVNFSSNNVLMWCQDKRKFAPVLNQSHEGVWRIVVKLHAFLSTAINGQSHPRDNRLLLESFLQACMTYTIAESTMNKLLMMDRRAVRNM